MTTPTPRIMVPESAAKGELFQVRSIISHDMETGLRHEPDGTVIPRKIINAFRCLYGGKVAFSVELHEAMAANPYLEFVVRAEESGPLEFVWEEDGGAVYRLEHQLNVVSA